ncbi:thioesterase II family protein [Streptomyces cacaoi]|uniref:thioesterase II family protein n=1 Tax=Streptomyces cacaoi TaxID=1898 RepID=UPI0037479AD7
MPGEPRFLPFWSARRPAADATVFCLPHTGGGASGYRGWIGADPRLDVQPVQLPGREGLMGMPAAASVEELVPLLGAELAERATGPTVLFGHSMGAFLAAELVAWLHRGGARVPELLVVSAHRGGARRHPGPGPLGPDCTDEELLGALREMGGTAPEALADPQLCELLLTTVRDDLRLGHAYRRGYGERELPVPVLACGGRDDTVTADELADWSAHTARECRVRLFPGGHFYLHQHTRQVLRAVHEALTTGLPPAPASRTPEPPRTPHQERGHHAADRPR